MAMSRFSLHAHSSMVTHWIDLDLDMSNTVHAFFVLMYGQPFFDSTVFDALSHRIDTPLILPIDASAQGQLTCAWAGCDRPALRACLGSLTSQCPILVCATCTATTDHALCQDCKDLAETAAGAEGSTEAIDSTGEQTVS